MCTVNGNGGDTMGATFTAQASGSCRVTANKVGNDNYNAAPQVTSSITVNKASQAITGFNPPATISQSAGSTLTLTATGGASGNPVTFSTTTPSVCTTGGTNGVTLTVRSAGNCSVTANQAGNDNYSAALPVTVTISIAVPAQLYFIHADHLGTPRAITKASDNTKVWEWKNDDPFGNNIPDENPNGANTSAFKYNLRFLGQYFDEETNTHYNYFRDYEPSTGRYVQSDPIGLGGGLSTYLYANANPLTFIDPSGESGVVVAGACVVVGTTIYFVWKFGKFKKCVEQCVKCPNNPDRDPNVQCQPLKDDGKTNPNASCKTYCTLDAFGGPRGKGPAGSRDYP